MRLPFKTIASFGVAQTFASDAAYVAAFPNPTEGTFYFNSSTSPGTYRYFSGGAWRPLTGGVSGPGVSVANDIAVFADTSGAVLADSGVSISAESMTIPNNLAIGGNSIGTSGTAFFDLGPWAFTYNDDGFGTGDLTVTSTGGGLHFSLFDVFANRFIGGSNVQSPQFTLYQAVGPHGLFITVASMAADYSLIMPGTQGVLGTTLVNDGAGNLTWGTSGASTFTQSTTNNTQTQSFVISLPTDQIMLVETYVVGRRTGGTSGAVDDGAYFIVRAYLKNVAGVGTIIQTYEDSHADNANVSVDVISVGAGGGGAWNYSVAVTGDTNNNYSWSGTVTMRQV